jgi:hypothetical protein
MHRRLDRRPRLLRWSLGLLFRSLGLLRWLLFRSLGLFFRRLGLQAHHVARIGTAAWPYSPGHVCHRCPFDMRVSVTIANRSDNS